MCKAKQVFELLATLLCVPLRVERLDLALPCIECAGEAVAAEAKSRRCSGGGLGDRVCESLTVDPKARGPLAAGDAIVAAVELELKLDLATIPGRRTATASGCASGSALLPEEGPFHRCQQRALAGSVEAADPDQAVCVQVEIDVAVGTGVS